MRWGVWPLTLGWASFITVSATEKDTGLIGISLTYRCVSCSGCIHQYRVVIDQLNVLLASQQQDIYNKLLQRQRRVSHCLFHVGQPATVLAGMQGMGSLLHSNRRDKICEMSNTFSYYPNIVQISFKYILNIIHTSFK